MGALILGSALAVAALAYVLLPLLVGARSAALPEQAAEALPPESSAVEALREIEFDQATGKLSPEDYSMLKAAYVPKALDELRARETESAAAGGAGVGAAAQGEDVAERLIARARQRALACPACGPRPESDALFCSDCGRYLGVACLRCGAPVEGGAARFCTECGASLAA